MRLNPAIFKLSAGLALLLIISFGKSTAAAAEDRPSLNPSSSVESHGTALVAGATMIVGLLGFGRRRA